MAISPVVPEASLLTRAVKTVLSWFGIRDEEQKMRENAANWLELADKVWHYRRDKLTAAEDGPGGRTGRAVSFRSDALRRRAGPSPIPRA